MTDKRVIFENEGKHTMKKLIKFRFTDSFKESGLATGTPIERFIEMNEYLHSCGEGFWCQILYGCTCVNDFDVDFIEEQLAGWGLDIELTEDCIFSY